MTLKPVTDAMRRLNRKRIAAAARDMISGLWIDDVLLHKAARQAARFGPGREGPGTAAGGMRAAGLQGHAEDGLRLAADANELRAPGRVTMTAIEWTRSDDGSPGKVWNPTTGCDRVSPGCDRCYAMTMAKRLKGMGQAKYQTDGDPRTSGPGFGLAIHPDALAIPFRWRKPQRVFVNSMSDLGHARVPAEFTARIWSVMARTPQHTYQILSKRPDRIAAWVNRCNRHDFHVGYPGTPMEPEETCYNHPGEIIVGYEQWPLPNVHIGTSIELDRYCNRADELRRTLAAVRFLSLEPLLGPLPSLSLDGIGWCIIGGESGPDARRLDLRWVRDLITQCRDVGVAVFVKQMGSVLGRELGAGSHGADWEAWPEDLRVREFPRVPQAVTA